MAGTDVAKALFEHLDGEHWVRLAELAHPGTADHIARIDAGEESTTALPAPVAVKYLNSIEVHRRGAAAAGDTRSTVLAVRGATATAVSGTTARLFCGAADEIEARLAKRSRLPADAVAHFATLDDTTAIRCARHVLRCVKPPEAATVLTDLARRETSPAVLPVAAEVRTTRRADERTNFVAALRNVLTAAGMARVSRDGAGTAAAAEELAADARIDLAAAALLCREWVRVSAEEVRAALALVADTVDGVRIDSGDRVYDTFHNAVFSTAAAAGVGWEELRRYTDLERFGHRGRTEMPDWYRRTKSHGLLNQLRSCGAGDQVFCDSAAELFADGPYPGNMWANGLLRDAPAGLDTRVGLRIVMEDVPSTGAVTQNIEPVFMYLSGRAGPTADADVVRACLTGGLGETAQRVLRDTCAHRLEVYAALKLTAAQSNAAALAPLWDLIVSHAGTPAQIFAAATADPGLTGALGALARRIEAAVGGDAPPGAWDAVCTLLETFDGSIDELADAAAALVT